MFLIDYVSSVITLLVIAALYLIVLYRKPDVNWGSSTQAQTYKTALAAAYRLQNVSDHVKNYHPQVNNSVPFFILNIFSGIFSFRY